ADETLDVLRARSRHGAGVLAQLLEDRLELPRDLAQRSRTRRGLGHLIRLDQQCVGARDAVRDQRAGLRVDLTGSAHVRGAGAPGWPTPTGGAGGAGGGRRPAAARGSADVARAGVVVGALGVAGAGRRREGRRGGRGGGCRGGRRGGGGWFGRGTVAPP